MPFAEVSSLLDPNMKGSKARKYLISYEEIKRRLQAPEKMSLRSLAAYTRVSRGPASKKTLLESLNVLGLTPSTTTSVSSSFSKLTEGDTGALCDDMKDFAHDYIDCSHMAKQLIPETNTVQHWSKIIETKNHLEDMRRCFKDPVNSGAFDNVTHGLGLGALDVALDVIVMVIEQQIRILSGAAASDPADSGPPMRRVRRRHRKARSTDNESPRKVSAGVKEPGRAISKGKGRGRSRNKIRQETGAAVPMETQAEQCKPDEVENNVLTLVSV
uniref:Si:ch73-127m5.2 n=2 Tax=Gasterosteus aculeatus TaxID=69293 RepID=G3NG25_GASAC